MTAPRILWVLTLSVAVGCAAFQPEEVALSKQEAAELQAKYGSDLEAMRVALEAKYKIAFDQVVGEGKDLRAILPGLIQETVKATVPAALKSASSGNPLEIIVNALLAAAGGGTLVAGRAKFKAAQKEGKKQLSPGTSRRSTGSRSSRQRSGQSGT